MSKDETARKQQYNPRPVGLYDRLPLIYRELDALEGDPLRMLLQAVDSRFAHVETAITAAYSALFVETCPLADLPKVASIVHAEAGPDGYWRRAAVADTLHSRRRKGTVAALARALSAGSGWWVSVGYTHLLTSNTEIAEERLPDPERAEALDEPARSLDVSEPDEAHAAFVDDGLAGGPDTLHVHVRRRISVPRAGPSAPEPAAPGVFWADAGGRPRALFRSTRDGDPPAALDSDELAADVRAARQAQQEGRAHHSRVYGPDAAVVVEADTVYVPASSIWATDHGHPPPTVRVCAGQDRPGPFPGGQLRFRRTGASIVLRPTHDGRDLARALGRALDDVDAGLIAWWDEGLLLCPADGQGQPGDDDAPWLEGDPRLLDALGLVDARPRWGLTGTRPVLPAPAGSVAWGETPIHYAAAEDLASLAIELNRAFQNAFPTNAPRVVAFPMLDWPGASSDTSAPMTLLLVVPASESVASPPHLWGGPGDPGAPFRLGLDVRVALGAETGRVAWPAGWAPADVRVNRQIGVYGLGPEPPGRRPPRDLPLGGPTGGSASYVIVDDEPIPGDTFFVSDELTLAANAGVCPFFPGDVVFTGSGHVRLVGITALGEIRLDPDVSIELEDCELRGPLTARDRGSGSHDAQPARIRARRCRLESVRCEGTGPVELRDCLVAPLARTLAIGDGDTRSGPRVDLSRVTVLGRVAASMLSATDCILGGRVHVAHTTSGRVEHCLHVGGRLPDQRGANRHVEELEPRWFVSLRPEDAGCGVLRATAPSQVRLGASDAGERGAFGHLHYATRRRALADAAALYTRVGWRALLHFLD